MDVARWLVPLAILGPFLVAAVAVAWVLAVRLRRINAVVRARTRELAASEQEHRRLIEDFSEGIIIHRLGLIRFTNAAARRLIGFTDPDEVLGQPIMDRIAPDHREVVAARMAGARALLRARATGRPEDRRDDQPHDAHHPARAAHGSRYRRGADPGPGAAPASPRRRWARATPRVTPRVTHP
jgi:PAS domain-containing protein